MAAGSAGAVPTRERASVGPVPEPADNMAGENRGLSEDFGEGKPW